MQYSPAFHVIALDAQRREFHLAGATGPTVAERPAGRLRTLLTRGPGTRTAAPRARRHAVAA